MKNLVIGIDVGGTNIKLGATDSRGQIVARSSFPTKSYIRDKKALIVEIVAEVKKLLQYLKAARQDVTGVGIGLPGLVDPYHGIVRFLPNIPGWHNVPLQKIFQEKAKIPTFIENDVNLITLGEWKFGAGVKAQNMVCMTLGTGVGSGLILNNQLYRGEGFVAGELGHVPLNEQGPECNCGGFGCFERYVGNKILLEKIKNIFGRELRIQDMHTLAEKGDERALKFWEETAEHIGNALTTVVNLLNPTLIIVGGGVANNYKFMAKTIEKTIKRRAMKVPAAMVKVVCAKLIDDAGIIGARVLVAEQSTR